MSGDKLHFNYKAIINFQTNKVFKKNTYCKNGAFKFWEKLCVILSNVYVYVYILLAVSNFVLIFFNFNCLIILNRLLQNDSRTLHAVYYIKINRLCLLDDCTNLPINVSEFNLSIL